MLESLKYKKKNVKPKLDIVKFSFEDLYPKRKTISDKIKEDLELAKMTRLLK